MTQSLQRLKKIEDKVTGLEKKEGAVSNLEVNLQGLWGGGVIFGGFGGVDSVF